MSITVRAVGSLKKHLSTQLSYQAPQTVAAVLAQLDLPGSIHFVTLVNERVAHDDTVLEDGDELQLVPVISGG